VAGSCENENGPSGFIKGGEFLDQLLKKDSFTELVSSSVSQSVCQLYPTAGFVNTVMTRRLSPCRSEGRRTYNEPDEDLLGKLLPDWWNDKG
jgi:hypothetical protein